MMASLGCCQEGSPCWNGRVAHKGDAEVRNRRNGTAPTPPATLAQECSAACTARAARAPRGGIACDGTACDGTLLNS
jgi:hypothetical protein